MVEPVTADVTAPAFK